MSLVWYITGVSSGIGESLTAKLLKNGYKVAGVCRDIEKLKSNKEFINNQNFLPLQVDLLNHNSISDSINKTMSYFGKISVVVNNAGFAIAGAIEETTNDQYKEIFDIMFFAPLNVIKSVLPYFRNQKSGIIFNIGSTGGISPVPLYGAYAAAKSALLSISDSLYEELKEFNIKVSYLVLGLFNTSILKNNNITHNLIDEYKTKEKYNQSILLKVEARNTEKLSNLIINYSNLQEIPKFIFCGGKDLMIDQTPKKINQIQKEFNEQILNSNDNTNV